jgi:hypothetical protein
MSRTIVVCAAVGISVSLLCDCTAQPPLQKDVSTTTVQVSGIAAIKVVRDGCYGTCPDYSLQVLADGGVAFEGREYVAHPGLHHSHISRGRFTQLVNSVDFEWFEGLPDSYGDGSNCATDAPGLTVTVTTSARSKSVYLYYGCDRQPAWDRVEALALRIEKATHAWLWVKSSSFAP